MERWRSFFGKAGENVWTIIEQAILLAAHDHPTEFKQKRCDIAETLFSTRCREDDQDATRPSSSVVTNCINRMENSEIRESEHASIMHGKVHTVHHTEQYPTGGQDPGIGTSKSLYSMVCSIKELLQDTMQPDGAILCGLRKLESLRISVDVLKESEIGKQVNILRKHSSKEISLLARALVRCWKELVDDWVSQAGSTVDLRGEYPTSERDNEEERFSVICAGGISEETRANMQRSSHCDIPETGINVKALEERGSSNRAELAGQGGFRRLEKPQFKRSYIAAMEFLQDEINIDAEGLGGKCSNSRASLSRCNFGAGDFSAVKSIADKLYGDYESQISPRLMSTQQNLIHHERGILAEKQDTSSKRKAHGGLIPMDNVKRKQAVHPSNLRGFSQEELVCSKTAGPNSHCSQVRK